jgi:hypothetical protein
MSDALWAIQTALLEVLTDDETLSSKITGVFDHVPEGQAFPYIVIGEATAVPDNTHSTFGTSATVTLHIWSAYDGFAEALDIKADVDRLVDHQLLPLEGHRTVLCHLQQSVTLRDPDKDVRHVPVRYRIDTTEAA